MQWRVPPAVPAVKIGVAVCLAIAAVLTGQQAVGLVVAAVAGLGLVAAAVRDLALPVRLAADASGVTVLTGLATRREIRWQDIERVRVDEQRRLLGRSVLLEIDTGDTLHFLSKNELGAPPAEVADELGALRPS